MTLSYGFYLTVAAILTVFCMMMSIPKIPMKVKFIFLSVGISLFAVIVLGVK